MGQIIIEIPQNVSREFRVVSPEAAKEILSELENSVARSNFLETEEIPRLLADRAGSAMEIAESARRSWKRFSLKDG